MDCKPKQGRLGLAKRVLSLCFAVFLVGCSKTPQNNPYPPLDGSENVIYSVFSERPKHLDPAQSYNANEWILIDQIYEPPLQYHYLKRPYELVPLLATSLPTITYLDKNNREVGESSSEIAFSLYKIEIKPGVNYQKHPAFAKDSSGNFLYHHLKALEVKDKNQITDFKIMDTREVVAEDFVYQIKRLASPALNSPIYGLMSDYIVGLKTLSESLKSPSNKMSLREMPLEGVKATDKYHYEIKVMGKYPQFTYWLATPFFAPMPWEAIAFYDQKVLDRKNISLDWFPIGTGPYLLSENNPNWQMTLSKNPDFHGETYPTEGEPGDKEKGLLENAGKPLPFLDKVVFQIEKETIPYWNKFLQGYYDRALLNMDNFDQAVKTSGVDGIELNDALKQKGIRLNSTVDPSIFYWGFNMLDKTVGGYSPKQRKLRQALSIALDVEEYINIFLNGNAIPALGPLPPGFMGYKDKNAGNPVVYDMSTEGLRRKSLSVAKKLLSEAGYPGGIDPKTKLPLVLYFDAIISGNTEAKAQFSWLRKQFDKLGIELVIRATQYNRFQEKMRNGDFQIYMWGWNADYPDPENFLFLLTSENSKIKHSGENASNYENPKFDALFDKMKGMSNSEARKKILDEMVDIVQVDAPWIWGFFPKTYTLSQSWVMPLKSNAMARNTIKYISLKPELRAKSRKEWNPPIRWPLILIFVLLVVSCIPAILSYYRKMHQPLKPKPPLKLKNE